MRQLHSILNTVSGLGYTRKQILMNSKLSYIHVQESTHKVSAEVRPTSVFLQDAAHPSCGLPNTSGRFALGAQNVCLRRGENPTCSVLALKGYYAKVNGHTTTVMHETNTPP